MKKALVTLALGTFGLGVTEFAMMGILPFIAADFGVSISDAGHLISSYALGVCVGAPLMVAFMRTWRLKKIVVLLMCVYFAASAAMALAPDYYSMLAMRFMAGLPHGAYFGVASIIADRLSNGRKSATAVAIMCSGMSVANLIGIPFGTFICQVASWRYIFAFSALWGLATLLSIWRFIPSMDALPDIGARGQFRFLKSLAPWLLIAATLLGNGGVFCYFSYYAPLLTDHSGISVTLLPLMSVIAGAGMVVGNLTGGMLSDRIRAYRTIAANHHVHQPLEHFPVQSHCVAQCGADVHHHFLLIWGRFSPTVAFAPIQQGRRPLGWLHGATRLQLRQCHRSILGRYPSDKRIRLQLHCPSWLHHGSNRHRLLHHFLPSIRETRQEQEIVISNNQQGC